MPSFSESQSALVFSLIVLPAIAAFLTARIEKIRGLVEGIYSKVLILGRFLDIAGDIRKSVNMAYAQAVNMLEDGKIDETEVRTLIEMLEPAKKHLQSLADDAVK